jgi:outer membrane protein assembly factor BamD
LGKRNTGHKSQIKRLFVLCAGAFIAFTLLNCAKPQIINKPAPKSVDEQFDTAMNNFQAKRYDKAITGFSDVIFNYPGSRYATDAQYYLALSNFEKKDYPQAIIEYDFFIKNFPTSPFLESATVQLALAYLRSTANVERDQTQLLKAQELLAEASDKFPESKFQADIENGKKELMERLAKKEFEAAYLYFRAQEFAAAKIYYQHLLDNFGPTSWATKAKFPLAVCYAQTGSKEEAIKLLDELIKDDSNPELQKKAAAQRKKLGYE